MGLEVALSTDRRTRKKQRTRAEIYDAAMELFARKGYQSVTIDMICEAADVGRSTFFLHFPAKAALLGEFSRRLARDFAANCAGKSHRRASEQLVSLIREIARQIEAQRESMLAMFREFLLTPEAIEHTREKERELPDLFEELVRRGQEDGEFKSQIHPRLATGTILSAAASILSGWVFGDEEVEAEEVLRQYLEMVLHGLGGDLPRRARGEEIGR